MTEEPSQTCQMIPRVWVSDDLCGKPAVGIHEHAVRVCADCAAGLRHDGFEIILDDQTPAKIGDRYRFIYDEEPQFNRDLTVVKVCGDGPDDLVFFNDDTHCKQKYIPRVEKLT